MSAAARNAVRSFFQQISDGTHSLFVTTDPLNQSADTDWRIQIAPATNAPTPIATLISCSFTANQTDCTLFAQLSVTDNRYLSPTMVGQAVEELSTTGKAVLWAGART